MTQSFKGELKSRIQALASENVLIGTSSWKYDGWVGQLYERERYITRGKFSKSRFEATCLEEYAEVFKTVSVDAGYYRFPDHKYLEKLVAQVPDDFRFSFKVTDEITLKHFPKLARHGTRAGQPNANFLNSDLFVRNFLRPCEAFKKNIGLLMFEFSKFHPKDFAHGRDFVAALDGFLSELPAGWQYGVEIRNKTFLEHDEYFEVLAKHKVAHVYNYWTQMPPVSEQMANERSLTTDFIGARFLLTPGTEYDHAVKSFFPYSETKIVNEEARASGKALIEIARHISKLPSFVFINNRLEGNALKTIEAMLSMVQSTAPKPAKFVKTSTLNFPTFWLARANLVEIASEITMVVFYAVYEITEEMVRAQYDEEAKFFAMATEEELRQHCDALLKKAAGEFSESRYGQDPHGDNRYLFPEVDQITGIGLEVEEPIVLPSGIKVWLQEETYEEY